MSKKISYAVILVIALFLNLLPSIKVEAQIRVDKIPMITSLKQISDRAVEITYDREVDLAKATKASDYWVQSLDDKRPSGIASLGKDDKVMGSNALTSDDVMIEQKDNSNTTFILTFNEKITTGKKYKLIICYVTVPGGTDYSGDNGTAGFVGA